MTADFYENLLRATDNVQDISVEKYATVVKVNQNNSCSVIEEENNLQHDEVPILNGLTLKNGDKVIIGFVENSLYNPYVIGVLGAVEGFTQLQSDWAQTDDTKVDFIKNKPEIPDVSNYYTKTETDNQISNHHDSSKQNTLTPGANISIVGDVISASSSSQVQVDYAQTDSTQVDFIQNKPNIRQLVIDVLNEKFDGMISNATVENGKLKVNRFNSGDFDDV